MQCDYELKRKDRELQKLQEWGQQMWEIADDAGVAWEVCIRRVEGGVSRCPQLLCGSFDVSSVSTLSWSGISLEGAATGISFHNNSQRFYIPILMP